MAKMLTMPHSHLILGLTAGTIIISGVKVLGVLFAAPFQVSLGVYMLVQCVLAFIPMVISLCLKRIHKNRADIERRKHERVASVGNAANRVGSNPLMAVASIAPN